MLFPKSHQFFLSKNPSYLQSLWLTLWFVVVMVFYVFGWGMLVKMPLITLWNVLAHLTAFVVAFIVTLVAGIATVFRHVAYGLCGWLDAVDISEEEWRHEVAKDVLKAVIR